MKHFLSLVLAATCLVASAQQPFPEIKGETPSGKNVTLPKDSKAGHTIIGLAYSKKAGDDLEAWYEPAYIKFIAKYGLFASDYDVDLYFVPMFVGGNKAAYGPVMKNFANSAEPEIIDHIVFFKGEIEPYQEAFKGTIDNKDVPYFFIMDSDGNILHHEQGAYTEEKLEAFEDILFDPK